MERITKFYSAWDKSNIDPKKNYGIHGVELRMVLKGVLGAVQFVLYTNWYLPKNQIEQRAKMNPDRYYLYEPMPADKGYHSFKPRYEGQKVCQNECEYLDGKPCYYDGSGLQAEDMYNILITKGSDGIWEELERYYESIFGKLE